MKHMYGFHDILKLKKARALIRECQCNIENDRDESESLDNIMYSLDDKIEQITGDKQPC